MSHKNVLEQLMPIRLEGDQGIDTTVEGAALDAAQASIEQLLAELRPSQGGEDLIAGWESEFGILPRPESTLQARRAAVIAKFLEVGGLSRPYFTALAAAIGYEVTIEDMRPFESGIGMVGYPIWHPQIWTCWRVNVLNHELTPAYFEGKTPIVEGAYLWRSDVVSGSLERLFERLKPAGTAIAWYYQMEQEEEMAWHFFTTLPPNPAVGLNGHAGLAVLSGPENGNVYKKIDGGWALQGNIGGPSGIASNEGIITATHTAWTPGSYPVGTWFSHDGKICMVFNAAGTAAEPGVSSDANWLIFGNESAVKAYFASLH